MTQTFIIILNVALFVAFIYLILLWTQPNPNGRLGPVVRFVSTIVKPFLALIRQILPPRSGRDYSPLILFFLIWAIQRLLIG